MKETSPVYSVPPVIYEELQAYCQKQNISSIDFETMRLLLGWVATQQGPDTLLPLLTMKQSNVSSLQPNQAKRRLKKMNELMYVLTNGNWEGVGNAGNREMQDRFAYVCDRIRDHILPFNEQASVKISAYRKAHNPRRASLFEKKLKTLKA